MSHIHMRIVIGSAIRIYNPNETVLEYILSLEFDNPEYLTLLRMNKWTGKTPKKIRIYERDGDSFVIPYGCLGKLLSILPKSRRIDCEFKPVMYEDYGKPIPLYEYQKDAVEAVYKGKQGILVSPAGSGKTQMGLALIQKWGRTALWITHTHDLLNQSYQRAAKYMSRSLLGTITGGRVDIGEGITFATVQTLANLPLWKYEHHWDVIIVDECHRACMSASSVTQFAKVLNSLCARHKYGLTATPHRADGLMDCTYALLGEIVHEVPAQHVADKVMHVTVCPVMTGTRLGRESVNSDGTLNYTKMINYLAKNHDRCRVISEKIVENKGHSMLVLSDRIEQLRNLMDRLPDDMYEDSVIVTGGTYTKKAKAKREQDIEDMRTGNKHILFATYKLAKEGLDIPRLDRLFMATPVKDYAIVTQSVGRIARKYDGKEPVCYDFIDHDKYSVHTYKRRCTAYRKCNCDFMEVEESQ